MAFSKFLDSKRQIAKELVRCLGAYYSYASVLGVDIKTTNIQVDKNTSAITPGGDTECGFVVKMRNGSVFYEYSLDDISGDIPALAEKIAKSYELNADLLENGTGSVMICNSSPDENMIRLSYERLYQER